mmetsp:Transcript_132271/g.313560  ORF Transcript_132271/g.313560 Transcript_132271/m.313560 type:complete len:286 (-) Transcript_132271:1052-1909(-)
MRGPGEGLPPPERWSGADRKRCLRGGGPVLPQPAENGALGRELLPESPGFPEGPAGPCRGAGGTGRGGVLVGPLVPPQEHPGLHQQALDPALWHLQPVALIPGSRAACLPHGELRVDALQRRLRGPGRRSGRGAAASAGRHGGPYVSAVPRVPAGAHAEADSLHEVHGVYGREPRVRGLQRAAGRAGPVSLPVPNCLQLLPGGLQSTRARAGERGWHDHHHRHARHAGAGGGDFGGAGAADLHPPALHRLPEWHELADQVWRERTLRLRARLRTAAAILQRPGLA